MTKINFYVFTFRRDFFLFFYLLMLVKISKQTKSKIFHVEQSRMFYDEWRITDIDPQVFRKDHKAAVYFLDGINVSLCCIESQ